MNVLFLTHRLPFAPNRGDRIRAYHMLAFLRRHASVEVLSLVHDAEEAAQVGRVPADRVRVVPTTPWRNKLRAAAMLGTAQPLTHLLLDAPRLRPTLAEAVAAVRPDVVLAFCTGLAPLAFEPALHGIPVVLDMVDVDSEKWRALASTAHWPMRWIYGREARCLRTFEARMVARARSTLVVAEREHRALLEIAPGADVQVVRNGVDLAGFAAPGPPAVGRGVVFCGVMNYPPNEEAAVRLGRRVWPLVRARFPDATLTLLGAEPTAQVRDLAAADPTIVVTGAVPQVQPYLWNAAVSVAPITTARGLQNKVLEALAAGLPVVISEAVAAGLPAGVQAGCLTRESDDATAAAIVALLERTPAARRAFASQADLTGSSWDEQMAGLVPILTGPARPGRLRLGQRCEVACR